MIALASQQISGTKSMIVRLAKATIHLTFAALLAVLVPSATVFAQHRASPSTTSSEGGAAATPSASSVNGSAGAASAASASPGPASSAPSATDGSAGAASSQPSASTSPEGAS